jgi:hypothetical protein
MDEVKPPLYIEGYAVERLRRHAHARESNPCFKSTTSIHFGSVLAVCGQDIQGRPCPCTAMAELLEHIALGTDNMSISEDTSILELGVTKGTPVE